MKKFISLLTASVIALGGSVPCVCAAADQKGDPTKVPSQQTEETEETQEEGSEEYDPEELPEEEDRIRVPETPAELGIWLTDIREQLDMPGLWSIPDDISLTPELEDIFNGVTANTEDLDEDDITPVAMINYQQSTADDSCNYCFLCQGENDGTVYWCLVFAHDDGEGNVEYCNTYYFDLQQAFESDIEETYLPDHPEYQDLWELPDSCDISDELMQIYNSAAGPDDFYKIPLGYMGSGMIDDMPAYCFLTTNNLYLGSNNGLTLTYVAQISEDTWFEIETSSFTIGIINECPEPSLEEELTSPYLFYTYGGWTVPSSMDIEGLPEEVTDLISEYEDGSYEPVSYVMYREYLHPDHTALLRVVLCAVDDEYSSFVFVEESEDGDLTITGTSSIDIDASLEAGTVLSGQEAPEAGSFVLPDSFEVPHELTDAYYEYVDCIMGFGQFGVPEYVIGISEDTDTTTYCFIARQGIFAYEQNDDIMLCTIKVDSEGHFTGDLRDVSTANILPSQLAPSSAESSGDVTSIVYATVLTIDPELAAAVIDEDNHDGMERHANVNNIEIVINTFDSPEEARESWESWHDVWEGDIVYTEDNYFLMDCMGNGDLFAYYFVSGESEVIVITADMRKVTTVAEIGDTLAEVLPA